MLELDSKRTMVESCHKKIGVACIGILLFQGLSRSQRQAFESDLSVQSDLLQEIDIEAGCIEEINVW